MPRRSRRGQGGTILSADACERHLPVIKKSLAIEQKSTGVVPQALLGTRRYVGHDLLFYVLPFVTYQPIPDDISFPHEYLLQINSISPPGAGHHPFVIPRARDEPQ